MILYVTGVNPRTGQADVFAVTRDEDDAQNYLAEAIADGWLELGILIEEAPPGEEADRTAA
jgi:hypothetical protein